MTNTIGLLEGILTPVAIVALLSVSALLFYCIGRFYSIVYHLRWAYIRLTRKQNVFSSSFSAAKEAPFRSSWQGEVSSLTTLSGASSTAASNNHSLASLMVLPNPIRLSQPEPAPPLVPNRRYTLASITSSEPVDAVLDRPNELPDTPSQSSIVSPVIHQYQESPGTVTAASPPHTSTSFDDTFSVTTLSTVPPSYRSRRPEHEIEPRVLPPAYGASSESVAHPPPAFNSRGRVLRVHGPRSLRSVSTTVSGSRD